jgi:hypothetical protein
MSSLGFRCESSAADAGVDPASAGRGRARMPIRVLRPAPHSYPTAAGHSLIFLICQQELHFEVNVKFFGPRKISLFLSKNEDDLGGA